MVNCGEFSVESIAKYSGGKIGIIRIAFHKHQREEAQRLCKALKENGFKVFFQPMYTLGYSDLFVPIRLAFVVGAGEKMP